MVGVISVADDHDHDHEDDKAVTVDAIAVSVGTIIWSSDPVCAHFYVLSCSQPEHFSSPASTFANAQY